MTLNRKVSMAGNAALVCFLLIACTGKEKDKVDLTKEIDLSQPAEVVIFAGSGATEETFNFRVGDSLRKKFPQYTLTQLEPGGDPNKNIQNIVTAGTRFDIIFHSVGNFEAMVFPYKLEFDHTEMIKRHQIDLGKLEQTSVEAVRQASGGKFYGLPVYSEYIVLFYNKSLFDKFGVAYPKDNMTWDQLIALSKTMTRTDAGVQYYGYTQSTSHLLRTNPLSVPTTDIATNTPLINKDDRWKTLFDTYFVKPTQAPGYAEGVKAKNALPGQNQFTKERTVAMYGGFLSSIMIQNKPDLEGLDWDVVSFPTLKEKPGVGSQGYPVYFGVTEMAKNKDAQMNVLKYLVSEEFQIEQARKGITPVMMNDKVKQEFGKDSPFKDKNLKAIFVNKPAPIPPKPLYDADLININVSTVNSILMEKVDMNTGLRQAEEQSLKKIEEYVNRSK